MVYWVSYKILDYDSICSVLGFAKLIYKYELFSFLAQTFWNQIWNQKVNINRDIKLNMTKDYE